MRRLSAEELVLSNCGAGKDSFESPLKGINPEYLLKGLLLQLKLQYFGHLMRIANSLKKTLVLRRIEGKRIRGRQRLRWLDSYH